VTLTLNTQHSALNWRSILAVAPLVWLWFTLINHLRVAWALNPQYTYGWAVPFLCLYLIWQRAKRGAQSVSPFRLAQGQGKGSGPVPPAAAPRRPFPLPSSLFYLLFAFLVLLFAPTRLIQEANPEWRLVSWGLALEVIGITLLLLRTTDYGQRTTHQHHASRITHHASRITHHASRITFPLCFFLVAVPWPTLI
jgi:hypothetical protein